MFMRINGVRSETISKLFVSSVNTPLPTKQTERIKLLGKNGTLWIGDRWNDRRVVVECLLENVNKREEIMNVMDYIGYDTEVLINFSNNEKIFYVGRFETFEVYEEPSYNSIKFSIVFICEPEIYNVFNPTTSYDNITSKTVIEAMDEGINYYYGINPTT